MPAGRLGGGQVVEGTVIGPADHLAAGQLAEHLVLAAQHVQRAFGEVEDLVALAHFGVGQTGADGGSDVAGERPGGGGPDQERFRQAGGGVAAAGAAQAALPQGEAQGDAAVGELGVAIGDDLVLADAGGAARAPGHHVGATVEPALLPTLLEEGPDHVVVFVGEGEVAAAQLGQTETTDDLLDRIGDGTFGTIDGDDLLGGVHQLLRQPAQLVGVVPVHPVAQAHGLAGLHGGEAQDARFAHAHELLQAVVLDVFLGGEAHLLLDVDLHPQALAVEAVLVAQLLALHGAEALEQVFIGASPAVMDAHGVVGGDGTIDERPVGVVLA